VKTKKKSSFKNWKRTISCYEFAFLEFLAVNFSLFYRLLMKWRTPVFTNEINSVAITKKDKVLHIGCGILPTASILIAEQKNANVVGIDNNLNAVKFAKRCVEKKNLSNIITIEYGEGVQYPVKDFDVFFIAANVWPLDDIFKHLAINMKSDARILCKCLEKDLSKFLKNNDLDSVFSIEKSIDNPQTYSFVLTKNG